MNSSLWSADIITHTKIAAVSLIAATAFAGVGISARTDSTSIRIGADAPIIVKARGGGATSLFIDWIGVGGGIGPGFHGVGVGFRGPGFR